MDSNIDRSPGIIISALRGGAGKTILSIGITAAWRRSGRLIAPFKKGPDYIDAGWLALAAGRPCYNLDAFLCTKAQIIHSFQTHSLNNKISVIEGNRGLYDGIDIEGSTSTAEIAKLLNIPVVLCIDCTKATRTMAAVVSGCIDFDREVMIKGVILNRVAGSRHENILRKSIEHHCGIPVVGSVPKLNTQDFPERHMGLVPTLEHEWAKSSIEKAADVVEKYVDLKVLEDIVFDSAKKIIPVSNQEIKEPYLNEISEPIPLNNDVRPVIGIARDSAFQFYYPDNIEALEILGAEIEFLSPLSDKEIPPIDALYIGGGFPETHAEKLAENRSFRESLKKLADDGLPVYAECGGLMYLGKELVVDEKTYPMTGILPIVFGISKKPQGHGYTVVEADTENPYFDKGLELRGHEFRYSKVLKWEGKDSDLVFSTKRGTGFVNKRDGVSYKNVFASYTHLHALGTPSWAQSMVRNAILYKKRQIL